MAGLEELSARLYMGHKGAPQVPKAEYGELIYGTQLPLNKAAMNIVENVSFMMSV